MKLFLTILSIFLVYVFTIANASRHYRVKNYSYETDYALGNLDRFRDQRKDVKFDILTLEVNK